MTNPTMTRPQLLAAISEAAADAKLPDAQRDRILAACADVKRVVRGSTRLHDGDSCPALLAGLYTGAYGGSDAVMGFMLAFDRRTKDVAPRVGVIEVTN